MGWYTVTKTIKGRRYLYLQMTYRSGGKVKTRNKYLGPASSSSASFGFGAPSNLPTAEPPPKPPRKTPSPEVLERRCEQAEFKARYKAAVRQEKDLVRERKRLHNNIKKSGLFGLAINAWRLRKLKLADREKVKEYDDYLFAYYTRKRSRERDPS